MKIIKITIFTISIMLLICPISLFFLFYVVRPGNLLAASLFACGFSLYIVNHIGCFVNVLLILVCSLVFYYKKKIDKKFIYFASINMVITIGYVIIYYNYLQHWIRILMS